MGDAENANEIIDDLKDQIHDLEQDLRESSKDSLRLESELQSATEEQEELDAEHLKRVQELLKKLESKDESITGLKAEIAALGHHKEELYHNYIKSLSIAETLKNGNVDYFKTKEGRMLLDWGVAELTAESRKIMGV